MVFIRSMLDEQAKVGSAKGDGFATEAVQRLTETELEAIAEIALVHMLPALAVPEASQEVRSDSPHDTAAEQLLDAMTAYCDRRSKQQMIAAEEFGDQSCLMGSLGHLDTFGFQTSTIAHASLGYSGALAGSLYPAELGFVARHHLAIEDALNWSTLTGLHHSTLSDRIKAKDGSGSSFFSDKLDEFRRQTSERISRNSLAINTVPDLAMFGARDSSIASRLTDLRTGSSGLVVDQLSAIDNALRHKASFDVSLGSSSVGIAPALSQYAIAIEKVEDAIRRAGSVYEAFPGLRVAMEAKSRLGLHLSKSLVSVLGGAKPFSTLSDLDRHSLLKMSGRGFGTLAAIGVEGRGPVGAISDLLAAYGELDRPPGFDMVAAVPEIFDTTDDVRTIVKSIECAWDWLAGQLAATSKTDLVTTQGLVALASLLLAFWSVIVAQLDYNGSAEDPTKAQIEQIRQEIRNAANEAVRRDDDRERHIRSIDRPAPLRDEPDGRSQLRRTVFPDQLIRVRDTRGSWAYVEVYDYASNQPISGWISRARLRRRN